MLAGWHEDPRTGGVLNGPASGRGYSTWHFVSMALPVAMPCRCPASAAQHWLWACLWWQAPLAFTQRAALKAWAAPSKLPATQTLHIDVALTGEPLWAI